MAKLEGGSWRWVILCCSFYHHACGIGPFFALNVYYTSWVDDFGASRGLTSWTLALSVAMASASGVLVASMVSRFGHRSVVIVGSLISTAGLFASSFATSIYELILLIGVQAGIGLGMQYLPCVAIIPLYFKKKRSMAMGIAVSGLGVGTFVYPPFLTWLEEQYTWRGAMRIVSGLVLNMAVCGALLRPVDPHREKSIEEEKAQKAKASTFGSRSSNSTGITQSDSLAVGSESTKNSDFSDKTSSSLTADRDSKEIRAGVFTLYDEQLLSEPKEISIFQHKDTLGETSSDINKTGNWSLLPSRASYTLAKEGRLDTDLQLSFNTKANGVLLGFSQKKISLPTTEVNLSQKEILSPSKHQSYDSICLDNFDHLKQPSNSDNVLELKQNPMQWNQRSSNQNSQTQLTGTRESTTTSVISTNQPPNSTSLKSAPRSPRPSATNVRRFLDLLKDPYFAALAVSNLLTCVTFFMPPVYMVDRAIESGVEKAQAALAMSMFGAGNLFGRVILGWFADHSVDSLVLNAICLILSGVATCLSPLCGASAVLHGMYGFLFGFFIGGFMTLTPLILVDLMGLALLNDSLGLILVFRAVGLVAGTPIPGWIYDATDSYTISFILHGIVIAVSGVILVGLKVAVVRAKKRRGAACAAIGGAIIAEHGPVSDARKGSETFASSTSDNDAEESVVQTANADASIPDSSNVLY